jgi:hypothetical protein
MGFRVGGTKVANTATFAFSPLDLGKRTLGRTSAVRDREASVLA